MKNVINLLQNARTCTRARARARARAHTHTHTHTHTHICYSQWLFNL